MSGRRDLAHLKAALDDNAEAVALYLFGNPSKRTRTELRFGKRGSTAVHIAGKRRGAFYSFEADVGGSLIDAFAFAYGCSFRDALEHARAWLGDDPLPAPRRKPVVPDVDDEERRRLEAAQRIYGEATPLQDEPGADYLRGRGITGWPDNVRWHRDGYLVFPATSPKASPGTGKTTAIQRIYINADGTAPLDENGRKLKRSRGPRYKGAVRFPAIQQDNNSLFPYISNSLMIAEGPETALSVWLATGAETWAALGSVAHVDLSDVPTDTTVIVCKDDDKRDAASHQALRKRIKAWRREGRTVLDVLPFDLSRQNKSDFNDALQERGLDYVRQRLEAVLTPPAEDRAQKPLMAATEDLARATGAALDRLASGEASALAMKVSLGLGKTEQALREAVRWIQDGSGAIVYAVPTHRLSAELMTRAEGIVAEKKAGIRIAVWRGREADDPDTGERMCRDIEAVRDVQKVGGDPQELVCKKGAQECPHFQTCAYQKQKALKADLWLVPHASLFTQKPEPIPQPSLLMIDEAFWQAGLRGVSGTPVLVTETQIGAQPWTGTASHSTDIGAELMPTRRKLVAAIQHISNSTIQHDRTPISREALVAAGLTRDECIAAGKLEWQRKADIAVRPGMSVAARHKALQAAQGNTDIRRMVRLWHELADVLAEDGLEASGRVSIETVRDEKAGTAYQAIRLAWREDIREGWAAPTLHMDATLDLDLARLFLPGIEVQAEIDAATPHQRIVQVTGKSFSKAALKNDRLVDELRTYAVCQAVQQGGDWLLVAPKDAEDAIRDRHPTLPFLHLAHHNAIKGRDEWRDVQGIVIAGRTQPRPEAVERMAGALSGAYVPPLEGWYPVATVTIRDRQGRAETVDADRHPHPLAEAVRAGVCEAELVQIMGRGRGVRRTAGNPLEIVVLGNVPVGTVDELAEWQRPGLDDLQVADTGVYLDNGRDAALAADISPNTLKSERRRRLGAIPYKELLYGNAPNLSELKYTRKGPGSRESSAYFDTRMVPDPENWLRRRLGAVEIHRDEAPEATTHIAPQDATYYVETAPGHMSWGGDEVVEVSVTATAGWTTTGLIGYRTTQSWTHGAVPPDKAYEFRLAYQDAGMTQEQAADHIGLSRPQLANALQGRFGLSEASADAFQAFLEAPPPVVQPRML